MQGASGPSANSDNEQPVIDSQYFSSSRRASWAGGAEWGGLDTPGLCQIKLNTRYVVGHISPHLNKWSIYPAALIEERNTDGTNDMDNKRGNPLYPCHPCLIPL